MAAFDQVVFVLWALRKPHDDDEDEDEYARLHLLSIYYISGIALSALHTLAHWTLRQSYDMYVDVNSIS